LFSAPPARHPGRIAGGNQFQWLQPCPPGRALEHFYKKSVSCGHGRPLLCPDQSARGLAQSKTLARKAMACVNAKRLGLRWPPPLFPKDVSPQLFLKTASRYDLWQRFNGSLRETDATIHALTLHFFPAGIPA
jgi:hypothetical protein